MFVYVRMFYVCELIGFVDCLDRGLIQYICEQSLEMCICLRPEFDRPEVTLCGWQDIKIHLLLLLPYVCRVTTAKVYNESVEIWKYQRYGMIVDFEKRLVLPPPFTVLCYIFFILKWLGHSVYRAVGRMCGRPSCCGPRADYRVGWGGGEGLSGGGGDQGNIHF